MLKLSYLSILLLLMTTCSWADPTTSLLRRIRDRSIEWEDAMTLYTTQLRRDATSTNRLPHILPQAIEVEIFDPSNPVHMKRRIRELIAQDNHLELDLVEHENNWITTLVRLLQNDEEAGNYSTYLVKKQVPDIEQTDLATTIKAATALAEQWAYDLGLALSWEEAISLNSSISAEDRNRLLNIAETPVLKTILTANGLSPNTLNRATNGYFENSLEVSDFLRRWDFLNFKNYPLLMIGACVGGCIGTIATHSPAAGLTAAIIIAFTGYIQENAKYGSFFTKSNELNQIKKAWLTGVQNGFLKSTGQTLPLEGLFAALTTRRDAAASRPLCQGFLE